MAPHDSIDSRFQTPPPMPPRTGTVPSRRRSIVLYALLTFASFGLFGLYWFCALNDDTNLVSGHPEAPGGLLSLFLSFITFGLYGWFWFYAMGQRIDEAKARAGCPPVPRERSTSCSPSSAWGSSLSLSSRAS